jgi:HEAT repeats
MNRTRTWLAGATCVSFALGLAACPSTQPPRKTTAPDRAAPVSDPAEKTIWDSAKDGNAKVRLEAITELTNLGSERALKILVMLASDPDASVRKAAEAGLVRRGASAAEVLVEALKAAPENKVAPVEALLITIGKPAVGPLMHALGGTSQGAKRAAVVIGKMKEGRVPIFARVLTRGGKTARLVAARQLAAIPTDAARLALVPGLANWNQEIRGIARKALKPQFGNKGITTAILQVFKKASFWQAYALALSVYDHPDTRVHSEIVYGFHTARTTFDRHALFSSLVVREDVWYGRIVGGVAHAKTRVRDHILKALWFEVTSLRRIQTAAKAHRDTAQLKWSTDNLKQLKKALRNKAIRKTLKGLTGKLEPYPAWRAAYLLKFAGGRVNLNKLRKKYIAGLNKILEQSPEKVGVDTILAAYVRLGDDAWKRSCPVDEVNGVCVRIKNKKTRAGWRRTVRYRKRKAKLVRQAQAHLAKAWSFWADGAMLDRILKTDPRQKARRMRARHYAAWAKWMKAELRLEPFLQSRPPAKLNFDPKKPAVALASSKRLNGWVLKRMKEGAALVKSYLSVVTKVKAAKTQRSYSRASTYWALGAVTRAGIVMESLGKSLQTVPMPKRLKSAAARDAFRAGMDKRAAPLIRTATSIYKTCLRMASKARLHWEWALICESGLSRTDLRAFRIHAKRHRYTRAPMPGTGYPHLQMLELMLNSKLTHLRKCGTIKKGTKYKVTLTPQGRVTKATPTGRRKPKGKVDTCIQSLLQSLVVPPFRGKTATLTLTLP